MEAALDMLLELEDGNKVMPSCFVVLMSSEPVMMNG
jgi:hypothetical protein